MEQDVKGLIARVDEINAFVGRLTSWLTLVMVIVTVVIVVMRYVFDVGFIWLQEGLTWMHAAVFMLGAAYTLQEDEHVRVDIFYREMSARKRAWVNLLGVLVFLFPLCAYLAAESWDYVVSAWRIREISRDTGGLPYPAIPLLKSMLLAMPALIALQGLTLALRSFATIRSDS